MGIWLQKTPEELAQEQYEREFKKMVEKLYGADLPREDYYESPEFEEDWQED
ncbi:MAG: hypothetical protein QG620_578 [Patescibacteria group bacterium]|nr:hypothetical protein [Patescibacteria group bacterium]